MVERTSSSEENQQNEATLNVAETVHHRQRESVGSEDIAMATSVIGGGQQIQQAQLPQQ